MGVPPGNSRCAAAAERPRPPGVPRAVRGARPAPSGPSGPGRGSHFPPCGSPGGGGGEPRLSSLLRFPAPLREGMRWGRRAGAGGRPAAAPPVPPGAEPPASPGTWQPRRAGAPCLAVPCQKCRQGGRGRRGSAHGRGCHVRGAGLQRGGYAVSGVPCSEPRSSSPSLTRISSVTKPAAVRWLCPQRASPVRLVWAVFAAKLSETQPVQKPFIFLSLEKIFFNHPVSCVLWCHF